MIWYFVAFWAGVAVCWYIMWRRGVRYPKCTMRTENKDKTFHLCRGNMAPDEKGRFVCADCLTRYE